MTAPIPAGFEGITPYICVSNAAEAIAFYQKAFGATEDFRIDAGGMIGHAELTIYGAKLMMSDPFAEMGVQDPKQLGGSPVMLHIYVEDVDAALMKAANAGATLERPAQDQFYGDRSGMVICPYGHRWSFATHKEDLSPEELQRRAKEMFGG
ncbi:MAG: VOC family protein [Alphaproteobacteria bacterium]|jgi:PhnB protein